MKNFQHNDNNTNDNKPEFQDNMKMNLHCHQKSKSELYLSILLPKDHESLDELDENPEILN